MKKFFVFLFFLSICAFSQTLVLKGEKVDYLVDFSKKKVFCGSNTLPLSLPYSNDYFFVYGKKALTVGEFLKKLNSKQEFSDFILPKNSLLPHSAQCFVRENLIFFPTEKGFDVFNLESGEFKGKIKCLFERNRTGIVLPKIVKVNNRVFLVFSDKVEVYENFEKKKTFDFQNSLFFYFSAGKDFFSFMSVEKPGGIFSIKTRFLSFNYRFEKITEKELDIFPKNVFPVDGNFVFEKKEVSVFSLFGSKRVYIVKTDLMRGKFKNYSFSLSHKRRHLFPLFLNGDFFIVVQCKDGKVYLLDLKRDKSGRLKKRFYYDYTFLRGNGSGVFYNEENGNYSVVSFKFSWLD